MQRNWRCAGGVFLQRQPPRLRRGGKCAWSRHVAVAATALWQSELCVASENSDSLIASCREGELQQIEDLLSLVVSPDITDLGGHTCLHEAALEGHIEVIELLLERRASVAATDDHRQTALHWAAMAGHSEATRLILQGGAAPNDVDSQGRSPLHLAAISGQAMVVRLLLSSGATATGEDSEGKHPMQWARERGFSDVADMVAAAERGEELPSAARKRRMHQAAQQEAQKGLPEPEVSMPPSHVEEPAQGSDAPAELELQQPEIPGFVLTDFELSNGTAPPTLPTIPATVGAPPLSPPVIPASGTSGAPEAEVSSTAGTPGNSVGSGTSADLGDTSASSSSRSKALDRALAAGRASAARAGGGRIRQGAAGASFAFSSGAAVGSPSTGGTGKQAGRGDL